MKTEIVGDVVLTKGFFESTKKFEERVKKEKAKLESERLKNLKAKVMELKKLMPPQEKYREWLLFSVNFFQVFSDEQDYGCYWYLPRSEDMDIINRCIRNVGRDEYGINRTKRGEKVTIDNVYWGDLERFGCFTRTVRKYIEAEQEPEDVLCQAEWYSNSHRRYETEAEKVVHLQVIPFIMSYLEGTFIEALWRQTTEEIQCIAVSEIETQ